MSAISNFIEKLKDIFSGGSKQMGPSGPGTSISDVKKAAQASNYNQASLKAFYALETIGLGKGSISRPPSMTAREYSDVLTNNSNILKEEIESIILNFEVAKYSELEVTFDDYRKAEEALEIVSKKFKAGEGGSPRAAGPRGARPKGKPSGAAGKGNRPRPKPRKRS
ncbi:MAG: DUF4129 domain-containing protein [Candidatus Heimdallarchaeota archaeon]|nr:DUF4129 domain-containing protein [Candidatus Heimdallarchaeota archaeon]MDH5647697.1 DUF4129 domain-containing protein [Candidatus Heimdallarchaeota archaeon]